MGVIAKTLADLKKEVIGVIPKFLIKRSVNPLESPPEIMPT